MPRRVWRSLDGPYVAPRPGDTVDLRGTTKAVAVEERKEILLANYYSGVGSYFGGYSAVTTTPGRPWTFERGVKEAYGRVPWVHAAVRVIAISQSRLRFGVKDNDKPIGEGATEVTGEQLVPLLNVRSNPVEYGYQLRQRASTQWMLSPRGGFIETVPPKNGGRSKRILELRLLPPSRTRIKPDSSGNIDHYEVDPVGGIGKPRIVDADRVRWFREPHPSDPFAGLTPLEAAGLSVEMDYFARLFNRQFMANDGRPGGIVGVTSPDGKGEPADDAELDRVERKFGGGPVDAGRLVVLDGTVTYTDVARTQRDLQWKDGTIAARNEIFGVFLVPVSAIDASGRTFSNAGQEWINFWTLMGQPHGDAFAWLFHDDVDGVPFMDYSKVAALQEAKETQRAEWRDEVEQGLRTPLAYAKDTGQAIGEEPGEFPDVPATRSLWLPAGKVPVAASEEDQAEVDKLVAVGSGAATPPPADGGGDQGGDQQGGGGDQGGGGGGGPVDTGGGFGGGEAKRVRDGNLTKLATRRQARARQLRAVGGGSHPLHDDEDKEDDRARPVEAALAGALTAMAQRQVGITLARVRGTKARMGTRHWEPKPGEAWSTKQLDPSDVVDPQQWSDQATAVAQQNLAPLAQQQHDATRAQAEDDGGADIAAILGPAVAGAAALLLAGEVAQLATWLATSAANAGAELLEVIATAERDDAARVAGGGTPLGIQPIVDAVQKWSQGIPEWVARVVPTSVAQAVEAGKNAVLSPLGDRVQREWRTKRDDKVRQAHRDAEGQVAKGGDAFTVGGEQLRYPRDPLGSPGNVINCRCRTRWRLAAKAEGKALAVGQNVVADVLRLPVRATAPRRSSADEAALPGGVHGLRGARVATTGALEGVAGRDHVGEMLLGADGAKALRRVRTSGGSRRYKEPIGAPIVPHPHLAGLGGRDHAAAVASDAEAATARQHLADRMTAMRGGMPDASPAAAPQLPRTGRTTPIPNGTRAVHEDGAVGRVEHTRVAELRAGDRLVNPVTGAHVGTVTSVTHGDGFAKEVTDKTPLGVDRRVHVDGELHGTFTPEKTFTRHVPEHEPMPAPDDAGTGGAGDAVAGDMAKAKAELAAKKQTVLDLIDGGMDPVAAEKEYARLLHNARFRYRRERLKAEKSGAGKVAKAVTADVAQGPKETTLASIGQQLLDDPESVKLDLALGKESGVQPKALYSATKFAHGDGTTGWKVGAWRTGQTAGSELLEEHGDVGPGAVTGDEKWYDKLTADRDEHVPVADLHIQSGYVVKHGAAIRRDGVSYLVETAGPEPTAQELARLDNAATVYKAMLATVPGDRARLQRGVAMLAGSNPKDDYWAKEYGIAGFKSTATGGMGGTTWWGSTVNPATAAHEFGHNLDSGAHLPDTWVSDAKQAVLPGQPQSWGLAGSDDRDTARAFAPGGELYGKFHETRPGGHPITPGKEAPTEYAGKSVHEDFAESVRLYLKDRREGKVGYLDPQAGQQLGVNVRFADLWPARAQVLDAVFGVKSDYETPFVKQQLARATAVALVSRIDVHEAVQQQGEVPESLGLQDIMQRFGLGMHQGAAAWEQADTAFKAHLSAKNEADALEHVKDEWGGLGEGPDAGVKAEMVATLVDGFGLEHGKATAIVADATAWKQGQLEALAVEKQAGEAKLAAEAAVQDVLSLTDLPKEVQTVIRKRRANVKLRAKQKGASPEQAEAIAAAYESEQVAKEAKKLGIAGQVGMTSISPKVATDVGAKAPKAPKAAKPKKGDASDGDLRITTKWGTGSTGAKGFLTKAGSEVAPHAKSWLHYGSSGKRQQAKSNIAATLAAALNNEQDWQAFRDYRNSGAYKGATGTAFAPPPIAEQVKPFGSYTADERQALLDNEMSTRIGMWASTSGDSNPFAVMMQQAVKDELGVPGPVGVNDGGGAAASVKARYPHVGPFYRRFVRVQYEHTQAELEAAGVEWVPLYRGMRVERGSHAWANESDGVHVPLQPASSFSTAPNVSARFAGGSGSTRMMTRAMVHRSMVLGSARTGFGCLNEKEWVVLAPNEDEARFQVRFGVHASKQAQWEAAFAAPAKAPPSMSVADATAAIKDKIKAATGGGVASIAPGALHTAYKATAAESPTIDYPVGGGGKTVALPRDAVAVFLEDYGYKDV